MDKSTIKVTGTGITQVEPDTIQINIRIEKIFDTYEGAYTMGRENSAIIKDIAKQLGLEETRPKTTTFCIEKRYETTDDNTKLTFLIMEKAFKGFCINQRIEIKLDKDNALLGKLLQAIGDNLPDAQIEIEYLVKDRNSAKLAALENAVINAMEKATIIARTSGMKLGNIINIQTDDASFDRSCWATAQASASFYPGSYNQTLDISPKMEKVLDRVIIEWELE